MKKGWMVLSTAMLSVSLVGCGVNDHNAIDDRNQNHGGQTGQYRVRNVDNENNGRRLSLSDRAERQVENLSEVEAARVIIANNNAYVALRLSNNDTANQGNQNQTRQNRANNTGNNQGNGNGFIENGTVNQDRDDADLDNGIIDGKGDAGNRENNQNNQNNHNKQNNENMMGGKANGNAGNRNSVPRSTNYSPVSTAFEQRVADQVRKADDRIHRVYVSINPDLYTRMDTYADDIRNNRNQNNLFDDFTNTVNGYFRR